MNWIYNVDRVMSAVGSPSTAGVHLDPRLSNVKLHFWIPKDVATFCVISLQYNLV